LIVCHWFDQLDLTVILLGDPARSRERAERRRLCSRFHRGGRAARDTEMALYRVVASELEQAGYEVLVHEIGRQAPAEVAGVLYEVVLARAVSQAGPA
jgi:dTMP kinase